MVISAQVSVNLVILYHALELHPKAFYIATSYIYGDVDVLACPESEMTAQPLVEE